MKGLFKPTTVIAAVGVFLLLGLPIEAKEVTPNLDVAELKPLQRFIGSWEQQVVSKAAEWTPEKTAMTCPSTVNWILGGRMIEHRCVWSPGDTHGLCLMAYDAENKEYRQWYFDSDGGMPQGRKPRKVGRGSQDLHMERNLTQRRHIHSNPPVHRQRHTGVDVGFQG